MEEMPRSEKYQNRQKIEGKSQKCTEIISENF